MESVLEEVCDELGICSTEFRLKNAAKQGTRRVDGYVYPRIGLTETIEAIKSSTHYNSKLEGTHRRARHRVWLLVQRRFEEFRDGDRQPRWHGVVD